MDSGMNKGFRLLSLHSSHSLALIDKILPFSYGVRKAMLHPLIGSLVVRATCAFQTRPYMYFGSPAQWATDVTYFGSARSCTSPVASRQLKM